MYVDPTVNRHHKVVLKETLKVINPCTLAEPLVSAPTKALWLPPVQGVQRVVDALGARLSLPAGSFGRARAAMQLDGDMLETEVLR